MDSQSFNIRLVLVIFSFSKQEENATETSESISEDNDNDAVGESTVRRPFVNVKIEEFYLEIDSLTGSPSKLIKDGKTGGKDRR